MLVNHLTGSNTPPVLRRLRLLTPEPLSVFALLLLDLVVPPLVSVVAHRFTPGGRPRGKGCVSCFQIAAGIGSSRPLTRSTIAPVSPRLIRRSTRA